MSKSQFPFWLHVIAALLVCALFVGIWTSPILLSGYNYAVYTHYLERAFSEAHVFAISDSIGRVLSSALIPDIGIVSPIDGRLTVLYRVLLSSFINWDNQIAWAIAGATTFAVALWFYWLSVAKVFSTKVAWVSLVIAALLPVYFRQATWFDKYPLGFLFFFASITSFVYLYKKKPWLALLLSGICFGAATGSKDVFLLFIPWIGITFLWHKKWLEAVLFFFVALCVYIAPYIQDIQMYGYPVNQNIARIWPGAEEVANQSYLHLYPDPYTYYFDRDRFDAEFLAAQPGKSLYAKMADEKVILSYGLEHSFLRRIRLGFWLLAHDILPFVQRQSIGGIFMMLFLIPGMLVLWKKHKTYAVWLLGLTLCMFIEIRFILLYERTHFVNIAWIPALLVALGIVSIGELVSKHYNVRSSVLTSLIAIVVAAELLQANRYEIAQVYNKSTYAHTVATAQVFESLPTDAVIAINGDDTTQLRLRTLVDRTIVVFRQETIERLLQSNSLGEAFETYGVTHVFGYDSDANSAMQNAVPTLYQIADPIPEQNPAIHSPLLKAIVHLLR